MLRSTWHDYQVTPEIPVHIILSIHPHPTHLRVDLHEGVEVGLLLCGKQERPYPGVIVELTASDMWLQPMWKSHDWCTLVPDNENLFAINVIAYKAGFVDAAHFRRTFVNHYGCTPRVSRTRGPRES